MFIGRKNVLDELTEAYNSGIRKFVLHGVGGVGKSRTFLKFASNHKDDYPARVFVDMRGLDENPTSGFDAMSSVILQFNPEQQINPATIENDYRRFVQQQRTMLFLDNVVDAECVEPLCQATNLCVFITSRNRFNLTDAKRIELKQMSEDDAVALMFSIADKRRFEGRASDLAKLAGYLPMALKVLASIIADDIDGDESVHEIIEKYQDIQTLFKERVPDYRNLTIDASFELSYKRLSADLQKHWRYLSVFPADFDEEAINAVLQIENGNEIKKTLRRASLLEATENKRSRFHDLARVYARGKLTADEFFEAEKLHCFHFGKLLLYLDEITLPNLAKFDLERTNIEYGFAWVKDKVEIDDFFANVCTLYTTYSYPILFLRLHPQDCLIWMNAGLSASRKMKHRQSESFYLCNLGNTYRILSNYREAIKYFELALAISREISSKENEGVQLSSLGAAYNSLCEFRKAIEYFELALKISRETGDRQNEGVNLGNLGNAWDDLGEYRKAIGFLEQAMAISKETGNLQSEGVQLGSLGATYRNLGEHSKAIECLESALTIAKEIGDRQSEGSYLLNLGIAYGDLHDYQKAANYLVSAMAIAKETSDRVSETKCLSNFGALYIKLGHYQKAIECFELALTIFREIGDRREEGNQLAFLGIAYLHLGEKDKAIGLMKEALGIFEEIESPKADYFRKYLEKWENESW